MMAVASTSCEPVTDAGVRYVAIAEDGTVVATMAEYIIGSLESMQSATTSDGGRTWTNADKTYRKAGNESVQIPRGIYAIQLPRFLIDTKNCGTRGGWAWMLLKVTSPRLLANNAPTAAPRATLSLDVNVARPGDDYDSGELQ